MCQHTGNPEPHVHTQSRERCCCHPILNIDDEIQKLEEQKRDLQEIIGRIDAKINHLQHVRP